MTAVRARSVQFIIKISKLCNLRCRYCYEYKELAKKDSLSRAQLRAIYANLKGYYLKRDAQDGFRTTIRFIWHGGEPLLVDPAEYWQTFDDQNEILSSELGVENTVQTNLTVLDDARIALLRDGFRSFGVSVDVFGGLRVDASGSERQGRVLENMDRLRSLGIAFGGLTVLTQKNIRHVRDIFRFYERANLGFRILPLFNGAFEGQHDGYEITINEVVRAYCELVDLWLESQNPPDVLPLAGYIRAIARSLAPDFTPSFFNKRAWNPAILVNTNGDLYHTSDPYGNADWSLGNLIDTPLSTIAEGNQMKRSLQAADERMAVNCLSCKFFGKCSGHPIVEDLNNCSEGEVASIPRCLIEPKVFEHISMRLNEGDAASKIRERYLA